MYNNQEFASPTALYQQQWFEQMIASGNPTQVQPAATPVPSVQPTPTPTPQAENSTTSTSSASNEWMIQWFDHSKKNIWSIGTPMFKYCKKRKEHYSEQFPDIWYKAPYKYHMLLEVEGMNETDNILALAELNYEDGQPVVYNKTQSKKSKKAQKTSETPQLSSGVVSNNENYFVHSQRLKPEANTKSEVTIGPFQFNICSYKQDGRKFRMVVYLYTPSTTPTDAQASNRISLVCCLVSPPFTIRAKKPIVSPGIKKNKSSSKAEQEDDEPVPATANKKRKPEEESETPEAKKQRTIPAAIVVPQPLSQPIVPPPQVIAAPAPTAAPISEDFFIPFDALSPSTPVKIVEKPLSGVEKVGNIVALFKSMDDKDRKELLGQLLENTYAHEKEFVRRKYFESAPETNLLLQAQQAAHQQYVQHFNMLGSVHSHHYMPHGTHMQVPNVQTNDVDQFFVDLL